MPVGSSATPFMGSLNGDNDTISNLNINATPAATSYIGLFGFVGSASYAGSIQNLIISNPTITVNNAANETVAEAHWQVK